MSKWYLNKHFDLINIPFFKSTTYVFKANIFVTTAHQRWAEKPLIGRAFTSKYEVVVSVFRMSSHSAFSMQVKPINPYIFGISIPRRMFKYLHMANSIYCACVKTKNGTLVSHTNPWTYRAKTLQTRSLGVYKMFSLKQIPKVSPLKKKELKFSIKKSLLLAYENFFSIC